MQNKIGVIVLPGLCVGLVIALFTTSHNAAEEKKKDTDKIYDFSNKVVATTGKLEEQQQVNLMLSNDVTAARTDALNLTNKLTEVSATLAKTAGELEATKKEVAEREAKIADLEQQNRDLDKRADELTNSITRLSTQITETERKLAASEGDKAFLEKELKRLMGEKAELERQFNDLAVLRAQVAKLKAELNIARRLEWIRKGLWAASEQKGAERLMQHETASAAAATTNHYDLNVEVSSDDGVSAVGSPP